jgi:hypothetical protein
MAACRCRGSRLRAEGCALQGASCRVNVEARAPVSRRCLCATRPRSGAHSASPRARFRGSRDCPSRRVKATCSAIGIRETSTDTKLNRITLSTVVTIVAVLIPAAAIPSAWRDTFETGRVCVSVLPAVPGRTAKAPGRPGRLRFVLQPLVAIVLGWHAGMADARPGRPAPRSSLVLRSLSRPARQGLRWDRWCVWLPGFCDRPASLSGLRLRVGEVYSVGPSGGTCRPRPSSRPLAVHPAPWVRARVQ